MKIKISTILSLVIILNLSQLTKATIVEYPLNGLIGSYSSYDKQIINVDLGVTFSDISNISIDWSGDITAELTFSQFPLPDGRTYVTPGSFLISLYKTSIVDDTFAQTFNDGGVDTYPYPESFVLVQDFSDYGWTYFYDGVAKLEISFSGGSSFPESYPLEEASGNIDTAILIIYGTVIPEPSSLLIISIGALLIRKCSKRNL